MTLTGASVPTRSRPSWEIADLYPPQGQWEEHEYLALTETTNRLVELHDGNIEVLSMPTPSHQRIVRYLLQALLKYLSSHPVGEVLFAPLRVRLREKTFREPDLVFMLSRHSRRMREEFWRGADLVMEVVSGGAEDRRRDLIDKRQDYARAGIDEYWIIDPKEKRITVLRRRGRAYVTHAEAVKKGAVTSALLAGLSVDAALVFDAAKSR